MAAERKSQPAPPPARSPYVVGLLAWLVPGAGHLYIGMRRRGIVLLVTICVLFWTGVAIGGLRSTVDPHGSTHWFLAEFAAGLNAILAVAWNNRLDWLAGDPAGRSFLKTRDIGVVYAGVAGLLNLLAIFDAIVRGMAGNVHEIDSRPDDAASPEKNGR